MRARRVRSHEWVLACSGVACLLGGASWARSTMLPAFTDESAAMEVFASWCGADGRIDHAVGNQFFSYWTGRYLLHDVGISLLLAGMSVIALTVGLLAARVSGVGLLRTPCKRSTFLAIGVGVVLGGWAGVMAGLSADLNRFAFPPCADSIAIPMIGLTVLTLAGTPVLALLGWALIRTSRNLPVPLDQWDPDRPYRMWAIALGTAALLVAITSVAFKMAASAYYLATPAAVAALYLGASTRAALSAPGVSSRERSR